MAYVQQPSDAPRLPLAAPTSTRYADPSRDSRLVNAFVEQSPTGDIEVYKRPGLSLSNTPLGSGTGRGVFNWLGDLYAVFGTTLYKNGTSLGTVNGTGMYSFSVTMGDAPKLFLHNAVKAYYYSVAGGLVEETYTSTIVVTGNTNSTAVITGISSTTGINVHSGILGAGIPTGAYVVTVDSGTQVTINVAATATASGVSLTFNTSGFPVNLVPGVAFLDGTTYVMEGRARIWGSEINDVTVWDGINYLTAQIEPDRGIALAKQLVYVIAFKEWSVEVFYDAANAVGSPLGPVQGAKVSIGCRNAGSVQDIEGTLLWVGQSRSGSASAMKMEGLKAQAISTPSVDRLLRHSVGETVWSWTIHLDGHRFYGVTFKTSNITLVYDLGTGFWSQWTDAAGNYFPFVAASVGTDLRPLLQHETDGGLYVISLEYFSDAGPAFPVDIYTPGWDGGSYKEKTLNWMYFLGDQVDSTMEVRVNDMDFAPGAWSRPRTVNLSMQRPHLHQCGGFVRRSFHFHHQAPTPFRLVAVELDYDLGTS